MNMHAYFYFFKNMHNNLSAYFTLLNTPNENMHVHKANTCMFDEYPTPDYQITPNTGLLLCQFPDGLLNLNSRLLT